MSAHRFGVTLDEALAQADAAADLARARVREDLARTRLGLAGGYVDIWRRWQWQVVDVTTGDTLAAGRAWTERGMRRRRYAAYLLVLDRLTAERRAES